MKKLSVLGSTGSIGRQTLDVVRLHPEMFSVTALSCLSDIDLLEEQIRTFHPSVAAVCDDGKAFELKKRLGQCGTEILTGMDGVTDAAAESGADCLVTGIVGMAGIRPTVRAIENGLDIAMANKETCVAAGHIIIPLAREKKVKILPVDSEHSAIFQSLQGRADSRIKRLLLTASGGPFYDWPAEKLASVTVDDALKHPTWTMGPKITVDSATMVNKGLEVIEARWLFDVPGEKIDVVVQRESRVHSAVEYEDGSIIAQMGPSDMRIPIQYALTYPTHLPSPAESLDLKTIGTLHFDRPRDDVFRGLPLAREALKAGGSMPCVFNAANEWANAAFRLRKISFPAIYQAIEEAMASHHVIANPSLDDIFALQDDVGRKLQASFREK